MRLSVEHNSEPTASRAVIRTDPSAPNLAFLATDPAAALQSFFHTVDRILADNPVSLGRLQDLSARARQGELTGGETEELNGLKAQALRQGRAVATVIGYFLKFKPDPTLAEIRGKTKCFQPIVGPLLAVDGDTVRDVLARDQDFTVEPYGVEMSKVMSPAHNGGFSTFVLSTDADALYAPDKDLLAAVCTREDAGRITQLIHDDCLRRVGRALEEARKEGSTTIDVVQTLARYVPVTLGHRYLGVPVASQPGPFELSPEMLACYGTPIDGIAATALGANDGVIPDERQMYAWIKAAFQHFFNNVQKDEAVKVQGFRACRQLLAYLLREVAIQRQRLLDGRPVDDTMLARLVQLQLYRTPAGVSRPSSFERRLVSDLRIAENVMGTIVGAIVGQEEATCRVIDSLMRLQEGEYRTSGSGSFRYGSFDEAKQLAMNVLTGTNEAASRATLYKYFLEALRLQPQGEVLLRRCARDGARIAGGAPLAAGTLVFVSHGSAMQHVPEPDAFILDRPSEHYLHYGWNRHTCLGQHVSPVLIVESMIALLGLQDLSRPDPAPGEAAFPFDRRFGRLQLDDQNLYATTFSLRFADTGSTLRIWPAPART